MIRDSRIAVSFVFGLVGGILTLTFIVFYLPYLFSPYYGSGPFLFGVFGLLTGISSGILVIVGASMAFWRPQHGVIWGIVMVVFGALSVFAFGGFLVGMALSITGGAIAIVVGSTPPALGLMAEGPRQRACTSCGMLLSMEYRHCPYCGHAIGQPPR